MLSQDEGNLPDQKSLLVIGRKHLREYGQSVVSNRALPDYRDGLKPVARRILWSMYNLGLRYNSSYVKSARVIGDTLGKFHPHGDSSVYDAMVGMVHRSLPLIDGSGNWGLLNDPPAAYRYSECRLSRYAQEVMLQPDYMAVIQYEPTFDEEDREPLYLPALLPNLLLNGTSGIAVGVTSKIPALHPDCVLPLIEKRIKGHEITTKDVLRRLKFNFPHGSECVSEEAAVKEWLESGYGGITFGPIYDVNSNNNTISVTEVPPEFNWEVVVGRLAKPSIAKYISGLPEDQTSHGKINFVIKLKNTVADDEFDDVVQLVLKQFNNTWRNATNVTLRHSGANIEFMVLNIANLLNRWVDYRIDLEVRVQKYIIEELNKQISVQNLLLLAIANKDVIRRSWDVKDQIKFLSERLKISEIDARTIVELTIRRLSRLSAEETKNTKTKLLQRKKEAVGYRDNPKNKVLQDTNNLAKVLKL